MTTDASAILDELRLATPDIGARRAFLIFEAAHGDNLDPKHRGALIEQYADDTVDAVTADGLFTDLVTAVGRYTEARDNLPDEFICEETGATRQEIIDKRATAVEDLAAELVPSPAVHTGPGTSIFDEPHADGAS